MNERLVPAALACALGVAAFATEPASPTLAFEDRVRAQDQIDAVSTNVNANVTLCHTPPGTRTNVHTIVVRETAVDVHLAHGDYLGECHPSCADIPSPLPRTGQTQCRGDSAPYEPIDCAGTGQDGEYQKGVSVSPRFTDNLDGTVTDNLTGLIWLRDSHCLVVASWSVARDAAGALSDGACGLKDGSAAGDWRLPNIRELESLVDFGQNNPALPVGHPFQHTPTYYYWSSTPHAVVPNAAWALYMVDGTTLAASAYLDGFRAWPVRGGQ